MAEEYADKMARKTDAELQQYVTGRVQYREDAVLAALDELTRRGQPHPDEALVRPGLEAVVQAQVAAREVTVRQQQTEPEGALEAVATGPALYSPVTIAMFSMFFSFVAGGVLLAINMFRLKEVRKGLSVVVFILALMVASNYALTRLLTSYALGVRAQMISVAINLVAVLAYLLFFWPRYVGERPYVSRPWLSALLVCMALIGVYLWAYPFLPGAPK